MLMIMSLQPYRVPNLVFLWHQGRNLRVITGVYKIAAPINFIRGISTGKLDSF